MHAIAFVSKRTKLLWLVVTSSYFDFFLQNIRFYYWYGITNFTLPKLMNFSWQIIQQLISLRLFLFETLWRNNYFHSVIATYAAFIHRSGDSPFHHLATYFSLELTALTAATMPLFASQPLENASPHRCVAGSFSIALYQKNYWLIVEIMAFRVLPASF